MSPTGSNNNNIKTEQIGKSRNTETAREKKNKYKKSKNSQKEQKRNEISICHVQEMYCLQKWPLIRDVGNFTEYVGGKWYFHVFF